MRSRSRGGSGPGLGAGGSGLGDGGPTGADLELRPLVQRTSERFLACPPPGLRKQPGLSSALSGRYTHRPQRGSTSQAHAHAVAFGIDVSRSIAAGELKHTPCRTSCGAPHGCAPAAEALQLDTAPSSRAARWAEAMSLSKREKQAARGAAAAPTCRRHAHVYRYSY